MRRGRSRTFFRFCSSFLLWSIPCWATWACGAADYSSNQTIVRQIRGVRRAGTFVPPYCYEWFIRAELFAARGELEKAVEAYRLALTGPEEDAFVLTRLAEALHQLGQTEASQKALERAESIDPRSEAVWLTRAKFAEQQGDYQAAASAYRRAESVAPLSAEPPLAFANMLNKIDASERAIAVLEGFASRTKDISAKAERAKLALCLTRRNAKGVVEAVEAMLQITPVNEKEICRAISVVLDSDEPFIAEKLIDRIPANVCDNKIRLRVFLESRRNAAAENLLSSALPETFGGLVPTARAYLAIDRPDLAEQLAEEQLAHEESSEAMLVAAEAKLRQGYFAEAAGLFSRVPSGTTSYEEAIIGLAQALSVQGLGGVAAETLASVSPSTFPIRSALAEHRFSQGDLPGSVVALNSRSGSTPQMEEARAAMLERIGETDKAIRIYLRLGKDRKTSGCSNRARAERSIAKGDLSRAIELLQNEVKASPENSLPRLRLAEVKAQANEGNEARKIAQAVLRIVWEPALRKRALAVLAQ